MFSSSPLSLEGSEKRSLAEKGVTDQDSNVDNDIKEVSSH